MSSVDFTPADISPCLTYRDAPAAIDWLCRAFGLTRRLMVPGPDGQVMHSELSIGNGVIMVSSAKPEDGRNPPDRERGQRSTLSIYVPDPSTHFAGAVAAGARIVKPLQDEGYGARGYMAEDCEGHLWYFGNYRPGSYWDGESA